MNSGNLRLLAVRVLSDGELAPDVRIDRDVVIEIEFENRKAGTMLGATIHLIDQHNIEVLATAALPSIALGDDAYTGKPYPMGRFASRCRIPGNFLNEGMYSVNALFLVDHQRIENRVDSVVSFTVHETGEMRQEYKGHWLGVVRPRLEWRTERIGS